MIKLRPVETISLCLLVLTIFPRIASAGCFIGPQLIEDDAYKEYQFTNNCPGGAVVHWKRTYKKEDGSQGLENGQWYVSNCSTETKQYFQGDYSFDIEVDQSGYCVGKDVKPANSQPDDASNATRSNPDGGKANAGSESSDLANRLAVQKAKNATAAQTRQQQDEAFNSEVKSAEDRFQEQQRQRQAEQQREAALQAEEQARTAENRAMAKCDADYNEERAKCDPRGGFFTNKFENGHWVRVTTPGTQCVSAASDRNEACKAALQSPDERVAKCRSNHDGDVAICNGNTDAYRSQNFVAGWVDLDSRTCLTAASQQERLCEAIARNEPQSRIDALTQAAAESKGLYKRIDNSYANWLPQNIEGNAGPSYAPSYVAPRSTYQGQPQRTQPSQSRPSQTIPFRSGPCMGDSSVCDLSRGGYIAPRPYVPPPQPRFIGPNAVR